MQVNASDCFCIFKLLLHTPSVCKNNLEFDDQTYNKRGCVKAVSFLKILMISYINYSMGYPHLLSWSRTLLERRSCER